MLSKELEFNIFGLNRSIVQKQITKLRKFRPCLIEGFPSTIELWAKYVLEQNIKDISPAMVQTSSETLSTLQRTVIEQAFNCKVRDWYGQSEYVVSVGECPQGSYHINESGILEVLKDGERASDGQIGEIVGTGLYNYSMPFIRYRTTDLGQSSNDECSCGRGLPLVRSLEGRISDSIVASDGRLITGASFEHYWKVRITRHTPDIDYVHVIQQSNRNLLIQIVKKKGYSEKETQVILRELNTLLGYEIEIKFEELDSVPIRRKWRFSESELPLSLI
jgi:phenylacetate-CoA ligase